MFPIDTIGGLAQGTAVYKLLKPWWDVLTDYLVVAMLMTSFMAGTMQISIGGIVCLPAVNCSSETKYMNTAAKNICSTYEANYTGMKPIMTLKLVDRRQYDFVDAECSANAVHFFPSYFSFIIFLEAIVLLIIDNFWIKFPKTASVVESFIALVLECHNSQGTCVDLSTTILRTQMKATEDTRNPNDNTVRRRRSPNSADVEALLMKDTSRRDNDHLTSSRKDVKEDLDSSLEMTEALRVKTLYEKVKRFRSETEPNISISLVYIIQVIMQVIFALTFFGIAVHAVSDDNIINSVVNCSTDELISVGHRFFRCFNALAQFYKYALAFYCSLLMLYLITCICMFVWLLLRIIQYGNNSRGCSNCFGIREYDFQLANATKDDVKPAKRDLAFLLHLLDESNKLFGVRFSVFLSNRREKELKRLILESQWPLHILKEYLDNTGMELKLSQLTAIPTTVFRMHEICRLTLEDCKLLLEEIPSLEDFLKLVNLKSLSLVNCGLTAIPEAVSQLRCLEELNLSRNEIQCIQVIRNMRSLNISYNRLQKVGTIYPLLATLNMQGCDLINIPEAVFKIYSLQTLNLSHNKIKSIPQDIENLECLETLDISHNEIVEINEAIKNLENLLVLHAEENPLAKECFDSIALCPKLQRIFTKIPDHAIPQNVCEILKETMLNVDVIMFTPKKCKYIADQLKSSSSRIYEMTSDPKGLAMIIINRKFNYADFTSPGSEMGGDRLKAMFEQIGFKVLCYKDLSKFKIIELLTSMPDQYKECDSFVLFIHSHGNEQGILCADSSVYEPEVLVVDEIVKILGEKSAYKGKPKMLFFQACRGQRLYPVPCEQLHEWSFSVPKLVESNAGGELCMTDGFVGRENPPLVVNVPVESDFLIGYSTLPGYVSWHSNQQGGYYLNALVDVFTKHAWEEDVLNLLSLVNSDVSHRTGGRREMQMPAPQSTLTKKLYLLPGFFRPSETQ